MMFLLGNESLCFKAGTLSKTNIFARLEHSFQWETKSICSILFVTTCCCCVQRQWDDRKTQRQ